MIIERDSCTINIRDLSIRLDFVDGSLIYVNRQTLVFSANKLTNLAPYEDITNSSEDVFKFRTFDGDIFSLARSSRNFTLQLVEENKTIQINANGTITQVGLETCDNNFSTAPKFKKVSSIEEFILLSNYSIIPEKSWVSKKKSEINADFKMKFFRIRRAYNGGAIFEEEFVNEKGYLFLATNSIRNYETLDQLFS